MTEAKHRRDLLDVARGMLDRLELNNGGLPLDPIQQRGWAEMFRAAIAKAEASEKVDFDAVVRTTMGII